MRQDMKKVLCESPRSHSSDCYHEVRQRENRGDLEDLPSFQGMSAPYHRTYDGGKSFTDHIAPLIRYLWGCIGRRFDDVWSEICAAVPSNNTVDQHLKGHVLDEIETHTYFVGEELWGNGRLWPRPVSGLYVDPEGFIRATKPNRGGALYGARNERFVSHRGMSYVEDDNGVLWPHRSWYYPSRKQIMGIEAGPVPVKPLGKNEDAKLINGIWYKFSFAIVPPARLVEYVEQGESKQKLVPEQRFDVFHGATVRSGAEYHASKQQMNCRELRRANLRNS